MALSLSATPTFGPKRPCKISIAFAISIVLSKPEDLSVREYIRLLRQHVANGRRENAISSVHRHLDRSSFWRSEYERLRSALRTSEDEAVDLRREIEVLKARSESVKTAAASRKRKKVDEDVVPVPRSPKRAKRDSSPVRRAGADIDFERDFDFSDVGEVGSILMRSLFQVHYVLSSHNRTESALLAHYLVRAASALPQVVQQTVKQSFLRTITGSELLKTTFTAASRAFASLIVGINRLTHVSDGPAVQGQVVYAYVQMYTNLLDTLEEASETQIKKDSLQGAVAGTEKRPMTSKGNGKSQQPKVQNLKDNATLNAVTCFLCGIIDILDPKLEAHKSLFEGFSYAILNKLGTRLYTCVFGHPRGENISDEILASNKPDEIEDGTPAASTTPEEVASRQAKLEAPYLVHLFTKLMQNAPAHLGASAGFKASKSKQTTLKASNVKGALAVTAKDRLQRTLVNCIFGTEGVDENDPFADCLKMPGPCKSVLPMPKVKEAEVQEWFKEELWRSLGWEILGKESGW